MGTPFRSTDDFIALGIAVAVCAGIALIKRLLVRPVAPKPVQIVAEELPLSDGDQLAKVLRDKLYNEKWENLEDVRLKCGHFYIDGNNGWFTHHINVKFTHHINVKFTFGDKNITEIMERSRYQQEIFHKARTLLYEFQKEVRDKLAKKCLDEINSQIPVVDLRLPVAHHPHELPAPVSDFNQHVDKVVTAAEAAKDFIKCNIKDTMTEEDKKFLAKITATDEEYWVYYDAEPIKPGQEWWSENKGEWGRFAVATRYTAGEKAKKIAEGTMTAYQWLIVSLTEAETLVQVKGLREVVKALEEDQQWVFFRAADKRFWTVIGSTWVHSLPAATRYTTAEKNKLILGGWEKTIGKFIDVEEAQNILAYAPTKPYGKPNPNKPVQLWVYRNDNGDGNHLWWNERFGGGSGGWTTSFANATRYTTENKEMKKWSAYEWFEVKATEAETLGKTPPKTWVYYQHSLNRWWNEDSKSWTDFAGATRFSDEEKTEKKQINGWTTCTWLQAEETKEATLAHVEG